MIAQSRFSTFYETWDEAEKQVADAMYEYMKPQILSMKKLASHGWLVSFLKITIPLKFKVTLGYGWDVAFPKCPTDTYVIILLRKDIYPSPDYLIKTISNGELYAAIEKDEIIAAMILNHECNEETKRVYQAYPEVIARLNLWRLYD